MKRNDILSYISLLAFPLLLIVLGGVLALCPDVLSFLISRFLGWGIGLAGMGFLAAALLGRRGTFSKILWAMFAFAIGGYLIRHPLALASNLGMFLGIGLVIRGSRDVRVSRRGGFGRVLGIATVVLGAVLVLAPMTATRLVFSLCGVAMIVIGIVTGFERLRGRRYLEGGDDPNIIDAL